MAAMKPGDRVRFREPERARAQGVAEDGVGRVVEVMALTGEGETAVVEFDGGHVLKGVPLDDLVASA